MYNNKENCADCICLIECNGYYCNEAEKNIEYIDVCPEGIFSHNNEKYYIVPVSWEMCGLIKVKAKSAEEAFMKVKNDEEDYPLPEEGNYVDASFSPTYNDVETIEDYTKMYEKGKLRL